MAFCIWLPTSSCTNVWTTSESAVFPRKDDCRPSGKRLMAGMRCNAPPSAKAFKIATCKITYTLDNAFRQPLHCCAKSTRNIKYGMAMAIVNKSRDRIAMLVSQPVPHENVAAGLEYLVRELCHRCWAHDFEMGLFWGFQEHLQDRGRSRLKKDCQAGGQKLIPVATGCELMCPASNILFADRWVMLWGPSLVIDVPQSSSTRPDKWVVPEIHHWIRWSVGGRHEDHSKEGFDLSTWTPNTGLSKFVRVFSFDHPHAIEFQLLHLLQSAKRQASRLTPFWMQPCSDVITLRSAACNLMPDTLWKNSVGSTNDIIGIAQYLSP